MKEKRKSKFVINELDMETAELLDEEISRYLPCLIMKQKEAVLTVIKTFADQQHDWWDEIGDEQKQAIDRSLEEMNDGKLTLHSEVMKKYEKWMKK